jgi:single-strand DNA-binding protein
MLDIGRRRIGLISGRGVVAMNETVTTIVGNVISDVKQRVTTDGTRVTNFRVASNSRRYDKEAEQWVDGDRLFVSVTCWRKLARGVGSSLVKGDPVVVTGRLYTRGYEIEGQKRSVTELEAVAVGPDLARCVAELDRTRREATADVPAQDAPETPVATGGDGGDAVDSALLQAVARPSESRKSKASELVGAGSS